jgi:hypothetical protein
MPPAIAIAIAFILKRIGTPVFELFCLPVDADGTLAAAQRKGRVRTPVAPGLRQLPEMQVLSSLVVGFPGTGLVGSSPS